MAKAKLKTRPQKKSVDQFLANIKDPVKRADAQTVNKLLQKVTGLKPVLWGTSIVGYGTYEYKYASGREGTWMMIGFSPRKQNLTIYLMDGFRERGALLEKLGKHKNSLSCLYITRLSDIDVQVLEKLMRVSYKNMQAKYGR